MLKEYKQILSADDCKFLADILLEKFRKGELLPDARITNISNGEISIPAVDSFVGELEKYIKADYGNDIKFVNSYSRVYQNNSLLKPHVDRLPLDVTLSLCVYNDTGVDWPIHVSNCFVEKNWKADTSNPSLSDVKANANSYYTNVGDAVACLGNRNPHWREVLECPKDRYLIQIFYHWGLPPTGENL